MSGRLTPPPPRRDREHHPSFSAALLDAIYHSLDADAAVPRTPTDHRRTTIASASPRASSPRPPGCPTTRRRYSSSTASSSPSASSARSPRRPCRVRPDPLHPSLLLPLPPPPPEKQRNRRKKKKKAKSSARFLSCLNALLCNRKPAAAKQPVAAHPTAAAARADPDHAAELVAELPASARSILSSRASWRESAVGLGGQLTPARRAVRFSPAVEVVVAADEESRRREREACRTATTGGTAAETERRVEELLRALGAGAAEEMRERERAKESSESSSDLFELESFAAAFDFDDETELAPRTRARAAPAAGLAPPRPRVLLDEMVV